MSDVWDDSVKRLFREHPQDFVSWLLEGARYRGTVSGELKNRTRRTDILPTSAAESPCLLSRGMKAAFLVGRDGLGLSNLLTLT